MSLKPITLYSAGPSPNPWKVAMLLSELEIPYKTIYKPFPELKAPDYLAINPNGRAPAIEDPNTGLTLWESGAILEYLVETYDKSHRLSFAAGSAESHQARQWLHFQTSGQGPYYGQAAWFAMFHPEKIESALQRYKGEIRRVTGVLEGWLEGKEFLVGGKISFADIAFMPWQMNIEMIFQKEVLKEGEFPNVEAWIKRITERPGVKKVVEERAEMVRKM